MQILVTNDDGIGSPGIWALVEAMNRVGEVLVVAPDKQQSGTGTSISLRGGMSVIEASSPVPGVHAYSVSGTPSDCVITGLRQLAQGRIELVVSGINLGANLGNDIPYSGTVMATLQGYFRKIPSLAISLALRGREEEPRFDVAARVAEFLTLGMKRGSIPTGAIINANVPNIPLEEIKGMVITRTASSGFVRVAEVQGSSSLSYSIGSLVQVVADLPHQAVDEKAPVIEEGTDIWAINTGMISITPLCFEVTDHDSIPTLEEHVIALESDLLGKGKRG